MKEKPDLQTFIEPEIEARVVAWVLGEASPFEAAEMERLAAEKPEVAVFKRRIEAVHGLVAEAARPEWEALRLSPERRQKVLETIGAPAARGSAVAMGPKRQPRRAGWRWLPVMAACLVAGLVLAGLLFPSINAVKESSRRNAPAEFAVSTTESAPDQAAAAPQAPLAAAEPSFTPASQVPSLTVTTSRAPAKAPAPAGALSANALASSGGARAFSVPPASRVTDAQAAGEGELEDIAKAESSSLFGLSASNEPRTRLMTDLDVAWASPVRRYRTSKENLERSDAPADKLASVVVPSVEFKEATVGEVVNFLQKEVQEAGQDVKITAPKSDAKVTLSLREISADEALSYVARLSGTRLREAGDGLELVPQTEATDVLVTKEYRVPPGFFGEAAARDFLKSTGVIFPPGATATTAPESGKLIVRNTPENLDLIDTLVDAAMVAPEPTEGEVEAKVEPFSTFSLHVSDVAFALAQAALAKGEYPDPATIRAEEFYNAFDYGDPSPASGEAVACRIEQSAHPVLQQRNLVRIAMRVPASGRAAGQPLRLTVLLDTSGSMERADRAASVQGALAALGSLLGPDDAVTLIGFARRPRLLAEQVPGNEAARLVEIARTTPSEGGTNLEEALALAGELAVKHRSPDAQNRIVLLTDGAANLGAADPGRLAARIASLRQQGIALDACGVGAEGLNDEVLEALTRKGDGRYYFLDAPGDADAAFARRLAGAFRPAAENVKVQVRFNPARVGSYRLIGFEKHRLEKEDFRNDAVDAAELAAEEAAVALYQVEVLPQGEGELGEVSVRFRQAGSGEMVERAWTMPYDSRAPAFDQATPSMQLAGTAALLAEKLRGGPVASVVDLEALAPVVAGLRGHWREQARVQELAVMFEQMRRMEGGR